MNIKDKIAIGLIIFIVIVLGFALTGNSAFDDSYKKCTVLDDLVDLAKQARSNATNFMNIDASDLYNHKLEAWDSNGNDPGNIKTTLCLYHKQSGEGLGSKGYHVLVNVLDFYMDSSTGKYTLKNNRNKGIIFYNKWQNMGSC